MVGLQYLFLEPNADDPLNKGMLIFTNFELYWTLCATEAAAEMTKNRDKFAANVKSTMRGGHVGSQRYDNVMAAA